MDYYPLRMMAFVLLGGLIGLALKGCASTVPTMPSCSRPVVPAACKAALPELKKLPLSMADKKKIENYEQMSEQEKVDFLRAERDRVLLALRTIITLRQSSAEMKRNFQACQRYVQRLANVCK